MQKDLGEVFPAVSTVSMRVLQDPLRADSDIPPRLIGKRKNIRDMVFVEMLFFEAPYLRGPQKRKTNFRGSFRACDLS